MYIPSEEKLNLLGFYQVLPYYIGEIIYRRGATIGQHAISIIGNSIYKLKHETYKGSEVDIINPDLHSEEDFDKLLTIIRWK